MLPEFWSALISSRAKPSPNVTLSSIMVTRSEGWGYVWRADVHDNRALTNEGMSRSVCWRKAPDEQPAVTSYPLPDVTC